MNPTDFLTPEDFASAPDDDQAAFLELVGKATIKLEERTGNLYPHNQEDASQIDEYYYDFTNVVVGLAKSLDIAPFKDMEIPKIENFGYNERRQFKADLDHAITQLLMGNARRVRRESIIMPVKVKERIRTHLDHIKKQIDLADMPEARKAALLEKLREFEASLEKERLPLWAVARFVFEVMSITANIATLHDSQSFQKLLSNVMLTVAEAKASADESQLFLPPSPPPAIQPPRSPPPPSRERLEFTSDLDDDIPF